MDKPNARELLKECREVLLRGQADEQMAMVSGIDAYLAAPNNPCPHCNGKGWTAEHSTDANAHDPEDGSCNPGYCKEIEVASDDLRKIRIALDAYEAQTKIGLKLEKSLHNAMKALEEIKSLA